MAKRIAAIISLSVIGILIVATIVMANIPINHNIKFETPYVINVAYGGTDKQRPYHEEVAEFSRIRKDIDAAYSENALTAMFNGRLGKATEVVDESERLKSIESKSDAYYVIYEFQNAQVLKIGNKEYRDSDNNKYLFQAICFEIGKNADSIKAYIIPSYDDNNKAYKPEGTFKYHKSYTYEADLSSLYQYLVANVNV